MSVAEPEVQGESTVVNFQRQPTPAPQPQPTVVQRPAAPVVSPPPLVASLQPWQAPYIPISPQRTPVGDTGPGALGVIAFGSATGFIMRRKRRKES